MTRKRNLTPAQQQLADAEESPLEAQLWGQLQALGLASRFQRQVEFIPGRRYKADFFSQVDRLVVECDGGIFIRGGRGGGHNTGAGYERDRRRDALAMQRGLRVLRVTRGMIEEGMAASVIESLILIGPGAND